MEKRLPSGIKNSQALKGAEITHYRKAEERPFLAHEKEKVTILFGGLTPGHEIILKGVLEGLGHKADYLPTPDNEALAIGKEYGNRGQCNPTYYTVGNLIRYLQRLKASGEKDIEDRYLFLTIGACGPCRMGMYEAEYRKALIDAGFGRFRVLIINQSGDVNKDEKSGLKQDKDFYVALGKGIIAADLINEIKYKIRPYEIETGATEAAVKEAFDCLYIAFREGRSIFMALRQARQIMGRVKVDYSEVRPRVKMIGEFWAQTTEGDGNYNLASWLEKEGCEVMVAPVSSWIDYTIWWWEEYLKERMGTARGIKKRWWYLSGFLRLRSVNLIFHFYHTCYRGALGFVPKRLPSQSELAKLGGVYYNTRIAGGEGHIEIAKNLLMIKKKKAHLVISVKPFGCMPSTQSDGVQVKVLSDYKEGLFIPIETSGDGEVNVKSRIQMKLHEARERAKEEFGQLLKEFGCSQEEFKVRIKNKGVKTPALAKIPDRTTSTAGNLALSLLTGK